MARNFVCSRTDNRLEPGILELVSNRRFLMLCKSTPLFHYKKIGWYIKTQLPMGWIRR